jgi:fibronectin type 3 domain-containing protein
VESAPSNEACVDVTDIAPPEAPLGLTVLAGDEGVELSWSASAEADLKVYRVYRTSRRQKELLAEVVPPETSYVDATLPAGVFARYTVTAVDQAGNESAAAIPADARRP